MQKALTRFWICLLALAFPVQVLAAVSMLHCGSHQRMVDNQAVAVMHHGGPQATLRSSNHHSVHDQEAAAGHHGAVGLDGSDGASVAASGCSVCAACSAFALPLPEVPSLVPPDVIATVFHLRAPAVTAMAAEGPDRPPRAVRS
ncbi:MAG: hypothetical protein ABIN96_14705 [Rubrivivax sp.]